MPAADARAEVLPASDSEDADRARPKKPLKRKQTSRDRRPVVWISAGAAAFLVLAITLALWLRGGPRGPVLVGKWRGAPEVREAVKDATNQVAKGQPVNPLALGFAQAIIQK